MATQNVLKVCLWRCVQNDTGQWVDVRKKRRERGKKTHRSAFSPSLLLLFFLSFLSFVCLHYLCWDFYSACSSLVRSFFFFFLAQLQGVNESISSKHVDFCFHGDPEGLTMSQRLRPTDWWKTLLLFSLFCSHCVPLFLLNSPSPLHLPLYFFSLFLLITLYISLYFSHSSHSPSLCFFVVSLFSLIHLFQQPFSSVSLFFSATFLSFLLFPFLFLTPSILLTAFLPLLSSMCEELW